MFAQDIQSFFKSKSNWVGLSAIVSAAVGLYTKTMPITVAVQTILGGLAVIALKDATVKLQ